MFFGSINTYFIAWNANIPLTKPIDINKIKNLPFIEIYLLCCKEPFDIIKNSIENLLKIDYPLSKLKIIIADDGKSDELRTFIQMVQEENLLLDIIYKNRIVINGHSKAGNINDTLYSTDSINNNDLILLLDCDMKCKPHILKTLVPYFYYRNKNRIYFSENIAFVQSPQNFTNIERWDILGQSYIYFYHIIMKSWTHWKCTPCCGTNVLFNRKALEHIGGFQYGSVTEDFLTAMYLHSKGFTSKYCDEILADGLAPYCLDDFYKQRFRWALGGVQLLKFFPKVYNKLSFTKFWIYFNSAFFIFLTPLLIFLVCSILLLTYFPNDVFGDKWYSYYFGSYIILHLLVLLKLFSPISLLYLIRSYQESIYMLNCNFIVFLYAIFNLPYSFKITPKHQSNKFIYDFIWCIPFLLYYSFALYIIFYLKIKLSTPSYFWLGTICIQMFPPIRYVIKTYIK